MSNGNLVNLTQAAQGNPQQQVNAAQALAQMNQQIQQGEMQIKQQQHQYASAYVGFASQAALEQFKQGVSAEDAIKAGLQFAETVRKECKEYEDMLREEAPIDPAAMQQIQGIMANRDKLEAMLKNKAQEAANAAAEAPAPAELQEANGKDVSEAVHAETSSGPDTAAQPRIVSAKPPVDAV